MLHRRRNIIGAVCFQTVPSRPSGAWKGKHLEVNLRDTYRNI
jgi:hypothetical protein